MIVGLLSRILAREAHSVADVCAAMSALVMRGGAGVLLVDYVQAITTDAPVTERRHAVTQIARAVKRTGKMLGVPVVLFSQLRRFEGQREQPTMSDLRESGELEEMAENVLLLWRDKARDRWLVCAKTKSAEPGAVLSVEWDRAAACVTGIGA